MLQLSGLASINEGHAPGSGHRPQGRTSSNDSMEVIDVHGPAVCVCVSSSGVYCEHRLTDYTAIGLQQTQLDT